MSEIEQKKAELKKMSARALQAKMDLHDLSEELPQNWEAIPAIAQRTYDAYAELENARAELKELKSRAAE